MFYLFLEFINIVFIFVIYLHWIHYIVIHFLVISFAQYKEYMICLILYSKFSDVLFAFTCTRAIGNLWSTCLVVNMLRLEWLETLSQKLVPLIFIGNILLSKPSRTLSFPSEMYMTLKFIIWTNKLLWSVSASCKVILRW